MSEYYKDLEVINNGLIDLSGNKIGQQWFRNLLINGEVGVIDAMNGGGKESIAHQGTMLMKREALVNDMTNVEFLRISIDDFIVVARERYGLPRPITAKEDFDTVTRFWYSSIMTLRDRFRSEGRDFRLLADIVGREENLGRMGLAHLIHRYEEEGRPEKIQVLKVIADPANQEKAKKERDDALKATDPIKFMRLHGYICDPEWTEYMLEQIRKSAPSPVIDQVSERISERVANEYNDGNFVLDEITGEIRSVTDYEIEVNEDSRIITDAGFTLPREIKLPTLFANASPTRRRILQERAAYVLHSAELLEAPEGVVTIAYNRNLGRRKIHVFPYLFGQSERMQTTVVDQYPTPKIGPDVDEREGIEMQREAA
jgi:hypothetical protein